MWPIGGLSFLNQFCHLINERHVKEPLRRLAPALSSGYDLFGRHWIANTNWSFELNSSSPISVLHIYPPRLGNTSAFSDATFKPNYSYSSLPKRSIYIYYRLKYTISPMPLTNLEFSFYFIFRILVSLLFRFQNARPIINVVTIFWKTGIDLDFENEHKRRESPSILFN